jgi:hypothetical protein
MKEKNKSYVSKDRDTNYQEDMSNVKLRKSQTLTCLGSVIMENSSLDKYNLYSIKEVAPTKESTDIFCNKR